MRKLFIIAALLLSAAPTGCSDTDSAELATGEIEASMHIEVSNFSESHAWVFLSEGFNDVILSDGDRLVGRTDQGEELVFELHEYVDFYETPLALDVAELTIELRREVGESALASKAVVPAPLALDMPLDGATLSVADGDVTLAWSNPIEGAGVRHDVSSCDSGGAGASLVDYADDTGTYVIPAAELASGGCHRITMHRQLDGAVDPALHEDSTFESTRQETFEVTVAP